MNISEYFPIWEKLTSGQQQRLAAAAMPRTVSKGTVVHNGGLDCMGLYLVCSGQLRAYILSDEGREITVYRLFERDLCLFSASCMMRSIQFDLTIEAERDTQMLVIPANIYKAVMEESAPLANFTNEIMASRFSEVMWLLDQILWKSFDTRLAGFLLEEAALEGAPRLRLTHEAIANHLGTAREVVTRMLRYFQEEHMVTLSRGVVELADEKRLRALAEK